MVSGVIVDPDEGTFESYIDKAMQDFFIDGIADLRAIVSDENSAAISWVFQITEDLVRFCNGRIIRCDVAAYSTGIRDVHLVVDQTKESIILPAVTPAEHFRVIVHPIASGLPYDAYLLQCRDAFHNHAIMGCTGIATRDQPDGIDYCIRIADELKRSENAIQAVCSGWIYGQNQYAVDIVLIHPETPDADLLIGTSPKWNFHSQCKLLRMPLMVRR